MWQNFTYLYLPHGAVVLEFSDTALEVLASQYGDIPDDVFVLLSARREIAFRMNAALGRKVPLTTALPVLLQATSHGQCLLPVVRDVCGAVDDWGDSRLTRAINLALLRVKDKAEVLRLQRCVDPRDVTACLCRVIISPHVPMPVPARGPTKRRKVRAATGDPTPVMEPGAGCGAVAPAQVRAAATHGPGLGVERAVKRRFRCAR